MKNLLTILLPALLATFTAAGQSGYIFDTLPRATGERLYLGSAFKLRAATDTVAGIAVLVTDWEKAHIEYRPAKAVVHSRTGKIEYFYQRFTCDSAVVVVDYETPPPSLDGTTYPMAIPVYTTKCHRFHYETTLIPTRDVSYFLARPKDDE